MFLLINNFCKSIILLSGLSIGSISFIKVISIILKYEFSNLLHFLIILPIVKSKTISQKLRIFIINEFWRAAIKNGWWNWLERKLFNWKFILMVIVSLIEIINCLRQIYLIIQNFFVNIFILIIICNFVIWFKLIL